MKKKSEVLCFKQTPTSFNLYSHDFQEESTRVCVNYCYAKWLFLDETVLNVTLLDYIS